MLVLSRRLNERILIGDNIRITVLGIRGNQVRLGIEAPGEVRVIREELTRFSSPTDHEVEDLREVLVPVLESESEVVPKPPLSRLVGRSRS